MGNSIRILFDGISFSGVYGRPWKTFVNDLWRETANDDLWNGAAAVAFYLTFSLFPALIFLLGLLPLLPFPGMREVILATMDDALPGDSANLIRATVEEVLLQHHTGLLSIGALLTLWAASSGIYALIQQLNFAFEVEENRPYWQVRLLAVGLFIGFGILTLFGFALVMLGDSLQHWLAVQVPWTASFSFLYSTARWLFVAVALSTAFSLIYYFGPAVERKFRFFTPGSLLGAVGIVLSSLLFKAYVRNFGNYNATYGSIGAVIVLMLWLNILGAVILLGSEVNAMLEAYCSETKANVRADPAA